METAKITKTKLAMAVHCKCGSMIAATMLYGGIEIDAEFMDTVAEVANDGGKIEVYNTTEKKLTFDTCKCNPKTRTDGSI